MNTGQIISGAGHIGLIGWILFGGAIRSDPLPFDVTQVTAVSSEEYAAIVTRSALAKETNEIAAPEAPDVPQDSPDLNSQADAAPEAPQPDPAPEAAPDPAPQPPAEAPQAEVSDEPPAIEPPAQDMAALLPDTSPRPQQRPAERVAPQQVEPPAPDTAVDDVVREEAVPDEAAETPREEAEATAPEAAATEIVTEADEVEETAPLNAIRPKPRPDQLRPTPQPAAQPETQTAEAAPEQPEAQPDPDPEPAPATATDSAGVEDALALALAGAAETPEPSISAGPPLSPGEKDGLRVAVQNCWNTGSLSSDALNTVVTVAFEMSEDSKPIDSSIRMLDSTGGTAGSAKQAYEAARRAIIRCGARGFGLPAEKYASWRNVELVFNPENMRIK
ncbi:energy transducer TonB [Roseovarius sp. Pro17]|uniref:energy transducer TonB n=1 Tax=Roseovarius sp. Pro17 TaxID=3108175 RepID=UPI002D78AD0A|nr:energy transducer TonB [Roseovarius sp. Pro17]